LFGAVMPVADSSVEAFSSDELARIRARLVEREAQLAHGSPWPASRRFETIYARSAPTSRTSETPRMRRVARSPSGDLVVW
jgi:hypothetical protein